jgi:hypothetical protein
MVGGTVVDVWKWHPEYIGVAVKGDNDYCLGIRLEKTDDSLSISRGDSLWWQGDKAMWTSKDKSMYLIGIKRLGYSYPLPECLCTERND